MIRIPDVDRFELRLADGATNPYLLQAAVIAAVIAVELDGISQHREPRSPARQRHVHRSAPGDGGTSPAAQTC
jgi:glutamine synthetase